MTSSPGVLQITNSPNSIINWQSFSINAGELTRFNQQSAASAVLNRVVAPNASEILGMLQSNGRVFLINPNGIVFGPGSTVDVAGLVASTLNLSNEDFLGNRLRFTQVPGAGSVVNQGFIGTPAGGHVLLVGPAVSNGGVINTPQGDVVLAAGNQVELENFGTPGLSVQITASGNEAVNLGSIMADSGRAGIFAGLINQRGWMSANQAVTGVDGSIRLVATGSTSFASGSQTMTTGPLSVDTGDLTVSGNVQSGAQTINATGAIAVRNEPGGSAQLSAAGGQTISAHSVEVTAQGGGSASIVNNLSGDQSITIAGGGTSSGLDVRTVSGGGFANVSNNAGVASQTVAVTDADHINVSGAGGGSASLIAFGGTQSLSITGSGANAINLGSTGAQGGSYLIGTNQFVTAGRGGEAGSITIHGSDVNGAFAGISSQPAGSPGVQTISTSGTLSVVGGNAIAQGPGGAAGIYDNTFGPQTISANRIVLQGGSAGSGNGAILIAVNGSQEVNAGAGGLTLMGGSGGTNNGAGIFQNRIDPALTQSIAVRDGGALTLRGGSGGTGNGAFINSVGSQQVSAGAGGITLIGGAGGTNNTAGMFQTRTDPALTQSIAVSDGGSLMLRGGGNGTGNNVVVRANGGMQRIDVGGLEILGGSGGNMNFAVVVAPQQEVAVHGDLALTGGASLATPTVGGGALLGGGGAAPTNLVLTVGGNVTLTGGSAAGSGSSIGANNVGGLRTDIAMNVGGNVTLNPGAVSGTRIGSPATNLAGGEIVVNAGGAIALNSAAPDNAGAIRTTDGVTLRAREITQGPDAVIQANSLSIDTQHGAFLSGANAVNAFNATNFDGLLSFNNASPLLTVSNVSQFMSGPLAINQAGDLLVTGSVQSGPQAISATGALTVRGDATSSGQLSAFGGQSISARSMEVVGQDGGSAFVSNNGLGNQAIMVTGGGAAAGLDVHTLSGSGVAMVSNNAFGATQSINVADADHISVNGRGTASAIITASGGTQAISIMGSGSNALNLGSSGALGASQIVGSNQSITAGAPGQAGSITIVGSDGNLRLAGIVSQQGPGSTQSVSTSGTLSILGGNALAQPSNTPAGIFHNGTGQQTISAQGMVLQGGSGGSGNAATIGANNGSQTINAGPGGIMLIGGSSTGLSNFALINQASSNPAFAQNVHSAGGLLLDSGDAGERNFALIQAFGVLQSIDAGQTTLKSGAGGAANFAAIQAQNQQIGIHGDLAIMAGGSVVSGTSSGGAGIGGRGGAASTATNLALAVDGNLTMTGGSVAGAGAAIGGSLLSNEPTAISIAVGGNVVLNPGTAAGVLARIGARPDSPAGGNIDISALGSVALNSTSPDTYSLIRTADGVTLRAREIAQGVDSRIQANALSIDAQHGASLVGTNAVNVFNATNFDGLLSFNNTSPLLTVSNVSQFMNGPLAINQAGDLRVSGSVTSGPQAINVTGGLVVQPESLGSAQLIANGGQSIHAGFLEVNSTGGWAGILNYGGDQQIATTGANAAGEGLAVRNLSGGFATIQNSSGRQTIDVRNADRVVLDSAQGAATVIAIDSVQTFSVTGAGGNALVLGSPGSVTQSVIGGGSIQTVVAGQPGEQGSITIYGTASGGPFNNLIVSNPVPGGTQTVSTSGALAIFGGSAPGGTAAGIFANGIDGHQTVNAGSILLQGGSFGNGNGAMIGANNGSQTINAGPGGIVLLGGSSTGANNSAQIYQNLSNPAFTQTVRSEGPLQLTGGDAGNFNSASIRANGSRQSFTVGDTTLLGGGGGTDNFAAITGVHQEIEVQGDLTLTARGAAGTPTVGGGTRIGGLGGAAATGTNLSLNVDGDVTITGGSMAGTSSGFGNSLGNAMPTNISVNAGGNVTLNGGTAPNTFATIGSRLAAPGGGEIVVNAGGTIALNSSGPDAFGRIATAGDVTLRAREITQGSDALIRANALSIETQQGASLVGANAVNSLSAVNSTSGAVAFNNTSTLLTVTGIDQVPNGALSLNQAGNLLIAGNVSSGAQSIAASGDLTVAAGDGPGVTVLANGAQSFNAGGHFSLLGGSAFDGYAQTIAMGPLEVRTGGNLVVQGGSGFLAYGLLYGAEDVRLTVGNEVHLDGGAWPLAFARIQSGFWDKIYLDLPGQTSGGYFVDGREGVTHRGLDGFFTGLRPARLGRSLIVNYGD